MTGKVFNSSLLLNIGSKLTNNPEQIKFITQMLVKSEPPVTLKFEKKEDVNGMSASVADKTEEEELDVSNLVVLNVTEYFR